MGRCFGASRVVCQAILLKVLHFTLFSTLSEVKYSWTFNVLVMERSVFHTDCLDSDSRMARTHVSAANLNVTV